MLPKNKLISLVDQLLSEGQHLLKRQFADAYLEGVWGEILACTDYLQVFSRVHAGCMNLMQIIGTLAEPWKTEFTQDADPYNVNKMMGLLEAIKYAVEHDLLVRVEDLVRAETFTSLLEQAEYLLRGGYILAAGVLGRAVLEEHLRNWCRHVGCVPAKARPTLNDFSAGLCKAGRMNNIENKNVESMAAVGNSAAHNQPTLKQEDVKRLLRDVRDFLAQHPLS